MNTKPDEDQTRVVVDNLNELLSKFALGYKVDPDDPLQSPIFRFMDEMISFAADGANVVMHNDELVMIFEQVSGKVLRLYLRPKIMSLLDTFNTLIEKAPEGEKEETINTYNKMKDDYAQAFRHLADIVDSFQITGVANIKRH